MEVAEGLAQLDPVGNYPHRAAVAVAELGGAVGFRLEVGGSELARGGSPREEAPSVVLPLRIGRDVLGTLALWVDVEPTPDAAETLRWAGRLLARGVDSSRRLSEAAVRRPGEGVSRTLARAPLTPRERDVVTLLVSGASTKEIAERSSLTVSTVNTYLKRIFAKLGVHSRVELVARMAGTDALGGAKRGGGNDVGDAATQARALG
jgi:DNA-binding CsgD family transcriptional regulator